jgi:transcriptional regulator with XRE-family HTH domain
MKIPSSSAVGHAVCALRERRGLPLSRVCLASGISPDDLRSIESGRSRPSIDVLDRISRALGSSLVDVVRKADDFGTRRAGVQALPGADGTARPVDLNDIARAIADLPVRTGSKVDAAEGATVLYAMEVSRNNQSAAARLLGMERKAFVRRLARARRKRKK